MFLPRVITVLFTLSLIGTASSIKSLQMHVPEIPVAGENFQLMCTYDLEGAQLYSIRWYKNMNEFYRYVPKESPATKVFPVIGMKVDVAASDQNRVTLTEVDNRLLGNYQCEVSADAPFFHTAISAVDIKLIVEPPYTYPNVTSNRRSYTNDDVIQLNCSSPPSRPVAANLTWYVNNQQFRQSTFKIKNHSNGYASSESMMELAANNPELSRLIIRCEASIWKAWKASSHMIRVMEDPTPASAIGRSLTGTAIESGLTTIIALLLQVVLQFKMQHFSFTAFG